MFKGVGRFRLLLFGVKSWKVWDCAEDNNLHIVCVQVCVKGMEAEREKRCEACSLIWAWWTHWHSPPVATKTGRWYFFFFLHKRWLTAAETGRGRALYPGVQFQCYLFHCIFSAVLGVQLGQPQHKKGLGAQSTLKNLAFSLESESLAQHISYLNNR